MRSARFAQLAFRGSLETAAAVNSPTPPLAELSGESRFNPRRVFGTSRATADSHSAACRPDTDGSAVGGDDARQRRVVLPVRLRAN
jgi:hypothetical protein